MTIFSTFILTDSLVTDAPSPTIFALTLVRFNGNTMETWRVTDRYVAIDSLVTIEALAEFRPRTQTILASITQAKVANFTLPALITKTHVWIYASSMDTFRPAHRDTAIDACPPCKALAALAIVLVIGDEARLKVFIAGRV